MRIPGDSGVGINSGTSDALRRASCTLTWRASPPNKLLKLLFRLFEIAVESGVLGGPHDLAHARDVTGVNLETLLGCGRRLGHLFDDFLQQGSYPGLCWSGSIPTVAVSRVNAVSAVANWPPTVAIGVRGLGAVKRPVNTPAAKMAASKSAMRVV